MRDLSNADRQAALAIELARSAIQSRDEYLAEFLEVLQAVYQFEGVSGIRGILLSPRSTTDALAIINERFAHELADDSVDPGAVVTEAESSRMALERQTKSMDQGNGKGKGRE